MTRLTNAIRLDVCTKILEKTFRDRFTEVELERAELAEELRKAHLGKYLEAYEALPKGLQVRAIGLTINYKGSSYYNRRDYFWKNQVRLSMHEVKQPPRIIIHNDPSNNQRPTACDRYHAIALNDIPKALRVKVEKHELKFELLQDDVKKLWSKIMEQLSVCTTVKKLNNLWPEAVKYAPKESGTALAVVVDREGVNNMIACMAKGDCK